MSNLNLHEPQRQAPLGVAIMFFQNLRRAINFVLAVLVVNFGNDLQILGMGYRDWGIILGLIFLVYSILQYRKFYFYVSGDNFIIEKGVLSQEKINVPFSRIQTVNTRQNILQRLLNLVGLKVDTAGSIAQEIHIPALSKSYAQELRNFLMQKRYEHQEGEADNEAPNEAANEAANEATNEATSNTGKEAGSRKWAEVEASGRHRKPLLQLSVSDLFRVGFTQNHLRSGLILFAVVNGYIWQFEDYLIKPFEPYLEETAQSILTTWVLLLPFAIGAFLVISVLTSLVSTILQYYGFKFFLTEEGLEIESGLFNRNSYNVPFEKIQYFRWESNPLRHFIGYRTLKVKQAGSQAVNERKLIGVPGLKARSLLRVIQKQYPDRKGSVYSYFRPHRLMFTQLAFWFGLLPITALGLLFYFQNLELWFYLPLPFLLAMVLFLSYRYWQSVNLRINARYIEIRKGFVFPKRIIIPNYKLQNLSQTQSFLQAYRGLKTFHLHTAAGSLRLSHLPAEAVDELHDYLAFCIESSNAKWM